MFYSLDLESEKTIIFRDMYYWTIFGGIDDNAFEVDLSGIPIIFGTFLISIVLMNILIAYLSNEYSRLEERQVIADLQTKAGFNLDMEVVISMFKWMFNSNFRNDMKIKNRNYWHIMNKWGSSEDLSQVMVWFIVNIRL